MSFLNSKTAQNKPIKFAITFLVLFLLFYYFNLWAFSRTNLGSPHYNAWLAQHFNYIQGLRWLLFVLTSTLLKGLGYAVVYNNYKLLVAGHATIQVVYSCLGLGVLSFFAAFVIAYPKPLKSKLIVFFIGVLGIEFLNVIRFAVLALYGSKANQLIDHHTLFNIVIYVLIAAGLYFWIKRDIAEAPNGTN
jgi:exosortase/archaeosortase family protein